MNIEKIQLEVVQASTDTLQADAVLKSSKSLDQVTIRETTARAISAAEANQYKTIVLTDLGCQDANFPLAGIARIYVQEIMRYTRNCANPSLEKIIICVENEQAYKIFDQTLHGYIDHIQNTLGPGPYVTVDIIIEIKEGIILIERSNPPYGWALPGGFLDYGESLEEAARREAKEETNVDLVNLRQFHTYSKPDRDPRFHTISTVFIAEGKGAPQFGDDAKNLKVVSYQNLLNLEYAFDHKQIIQDFLKTK